MTTNVSHSFPTRIAVSSLKRTPPGIVAQLCVLEDPISSLFLADDSVHGLSDKDICPEVSFLDITALRG